MSALVVDTNILFSTLIGGRKVKETFLKAHAHYVYILKSLLYLSKYIVYRS